MRGGDLSTEPHDRMGPLGDNLVGVFGQDDGEIGKRTRCCGPCSVGLTHSDPHLHHIQQDDETET